MEPVFILLKVVLLFIPSAAGQDCAELQLSDLGSTTTPSSNGLLADTLAAVSGDADPMVSVIQMNTVCLGQGMTRDTYRTTSIVVEYASASSSSTITVQVEYQCSGRVWGFGSQPSLTSDLTGTLTTALRTDCILCFNPDLAPSEVNVSAAEHCAACNPCLGLMRCTGQFSSQTCCNYFNMAGECVVNCPTNSTPNTTTFECVCDPGYVLETSMTSCQEINECDSNPCQNGGSCNNLINDFSCNCAAGYTGNTCGTIINDCDQNPCENGGTCTDGVDTFTCSCATGFTGNTCSSVIVVDNCDPNPCQSGGTCTNEVNTFSCACAPGFTGNTCNSMVANTNCDPNPCQNGGSCRNLTDGFSCTCAFGFSGETCNNTIIKCKIANCAMCSENNVCVKCNGDSKLEENKCEDSPNNMPIIVGVVVGVGVPLLIVVTVAIIIAVVYVVKKRG